MSYMSLLETNARYSVAISILNNFRHWLMGREDANFQDEDAEIFLESIDINQTPKLSSKMILYSFQGFGNDQRSAAVELSDALTEALEKFETDERNQRLEILTELIKSKDINLLSEPDKQGTMRLVIDTMQIINSQVERSPDNNFARKDL